MKIAVMSDSHDNIWNLRKALCAAKDAGAERLIHCGDFIAPFTFLELISGGIPTDCVFGNNDGDRYLLTKTAMDSKGLIKLHGEIGRIDAADRKIFFVHEPETAYGLAASHNPDLVCFGHIHMHVAEKKGKTLILNPGEIMGKEGDPGFCIIDLTDMTYSRISIK